MQAIYNNNASGELSRKKYNKAGLQSDCMISFSYYTHLSNTMTLVRNTSSPGRSSPDLQIEMQIEIQTEFCVGAQDKSP